MKKNFTFPKIDCKICNYPLLSCGDSKYYKICLNPQFWWYHETINTFGFLVKHMSHREDYFFVDGSFLQNENQITVQPELKEVANAEIITVLHRSNHFSAVGVTIQKKIIKEIIIYDGKHKNPVVWWKQRLRCLLRKIGHPKSNLKKARGYTSDDFFGIDFINQPCNDNSNCGPIAAMVILYKFLPEEIDYTLSVPAFRSFILEKLTCMLDKTSTV